MGQTTLRWSLGQVPNAMGFNSALLWPFGQLSESLPWSAQVTQVEVDSIIRSQLQQNGVRTEPMWAIVENGYLVNCSKNLTPI